MDKKKLSFILIFIFIFSSLNTINVSAETLDINGFDKGPSYTNIVPMKKITMIGYDEDSLIDDYAYLAAVPTAVFKDQDPKQNRLFSHPLLFYQDEYKSNEFYEKTLDARTGLDFFMEDWMQYCNTQLDQMTLINVDENKINKTWKSDDKVIVESYNAFEIAEELALNQWSYSDKAVVAVIDEEFQKPDYTVNNQINGLLKPKKVFNDIVLELEQTNSINPIFHQFNVDEGYSYMIADCWWDSLFFSGLVIPTADPDLQLYCKKNDKWMQAAAVSNWNVFSPKGHEFTQSYIYNPGEWRVGITDFPTEGDAPSKNFLGGLVTLQGTLKNVLSKKVTYHVDITMYPGDIFEIPDNPPFGCRNADFELSWDNPSINLGFTIIGPAGEAIYTNLVDDDKQNKKIHLDFLGENLDHEKIQVSVFSTDDINQEIDFNIKYSMNQNISNKQADCLSSATEGAVLASQLNAPLLYIKDSNIPDVTKDTLLKLGVNKIILINIGGHLKTKTYDELKNIADITHNYKELKPIYDKIREITKSTDIVFSTIDPWTYWVLTDSDPSGPVGDKTGSLFIGPAAYIAAHHGSSVIIIDNHPRLSSSAVWHNEFWKRYFNKRFQMIPSTGEMVFTGRRIYDFLSEYNFDYDGAETIITVADQYDIGISWDRIFPGVANSGRICGSPVDTAYWISRSVFYPALIFSNPGISSQNKYIQGSSSSREGIIGLLKNPKFNTLVVNEKADQTCTNPVLCSFVTHKYRFNERASKYYGTVYQCADGTFPGITSTMEKIDQGSINMHTELTGSYFPDISESEIIPFYLEKGDYDAVFSTNIDAVMNNLNNGVILWIHSSHGTQGSSCVGSTLFWDPVSGFDAHSKYSKYFAGALKEENPWRGYDWYLGCTEEPDTMSLDLYGYFPFSNLRFFIPATGLDYVLARKPIKEKIPEFLRDFLNKLFLFNDPFEVDDLYDGLTGTVQYSKYPLWWKNGKLIDSKLKNIHSTGFITSICQTSNTYLHLSLIRHGSVFQVQDPWPTSWYGAIWRQSIPRDIILGYTVGEAYTKGMSHVGTLYLGTGGSVENDPQWWWDTYENVVYFGDPDLRMYVPGTEYSSENHWDKKDVEPMIYNPEINVNGHMPFGATSYPNEKQQYSLIQQYLLVIIILITILFLIIAIMITSKKRK